jgi:LuxR family maltose regulon positive regulatory protein
MTRIQQLIDGPSIAHEHPALIVAVAGLRTAGVATADALAATSLTARERSLLEFLPSHLSYAQIAARTFLSVNTVKSNLKSVYRKLGVASRAEAVELARGAGLI